MIRFLRSVPRRVAHYFAALAAKDELAMANECEHQPVGACDDCRRDWWAHSIG